MKFLNFAILLCLHTSLAHAQEEKFRLTAIVINGLEKTAPDVILTELDFTAGQSVSQAQIEQGMVRVRNTQLFTNVSHKLIDSPRGKSLVIHAEDRWTTIPIFKFASGGGVTQVIAGMFDPNILGKNIEAGGQYERLGQTNSGVLWLKNPRLLGSFLSIDLQYWRINRLRTKYFLEPIEPQIKAGFLHKRDKQFIKLGYEFLWWLRTGIFFEQHQDEFTDDYVSDEVKSARVSDQPPPDTDVQLTGLIFEVGQLDRRDELIDGIQSNWEYRFGNAKTQGIPNFHQWDLSLLAYKTIGNRLNLAERIMLGRTTTETIQYWYYLGGFDRIRGFADNRFAGKQFWLSNSEIRLTSFRGNDVTIQNNMFYDVVGIGEDGSELETARGASVGGGIRLILPKVYRFVGRLDYAQTVLRKDERSISFGVQQFF